MFIKRNNKKGVRYYLLLFLTGILLLFSIFLFDMLFERLGFNQNMKHIAWLWLSVIVGSGAIYPWKYRRRSWLIKGMLMSNVLFLTTLYGFILYYLDKIGYQFIPMVGIRSLAHGLGLMLTIFIINEEFLVKYLIKKEKGMFRDAPN